MLGDDKLTVTVTVAGPAGSGKSTVVHLLERILRDHGITAEVTGDCEVTDQDILVTHPLRKLTEAVAGKTRVLIRSRQVRRADW